MATTTVPHRKRSLTTEQCSESFRKWESGIPVGVIAEKLGFAPSTVQRAINRIRAKQFRKAEICCIYNADFDSPDSDRVILGPPPLPDKVQKLRPPAADLPEYMASLYCVPLLTPAQEVYWFRRMNYLKHLATRAIEKMHPTRPSTRQLDRISDWLSQSEYARNLLVRSNLRLVVSVARNYSSYPAQLLDRISDGNQALMRAVELFDYGRGFRLSTYATWAIRRNLSREAGRENRQHGRFTPAVPEFLDSHPSTNGSVLKEEIRHNEQQQRVNALLEQLEPREGNILRQRYGVGDADQPQTLREIGVQHGVSKERIRQIEIRALNKLHAIAVREQPELIEMLSA